MPHCRISVTVVNISSESLALAWSSYPACSHPDPCRRAPILHWRSFIFLKCLLYILPSWQSLYFHLQNMLYVDRIKQSVFRYNNKHVHDKACCSPCNKMGHTTTKSFLFKRTEPDGLGYFCQPPIELLDAKIKTNRETKICDVHKTTATRTYRS